jgi:heterodisulfide reductase subunit C
MTETKTTKGLKIDPAFKYVVSKEPGGEKLMRCFQCGTCTSDCPVARFSDTYRPRQIIRMAQLGLEDKLFESDTLWLCASCFTCTDRCPQGVEVASVIRVLRNLAAKKGYVPQVFREQALSILESGCAYKIPETRIKRRVELGLPPLPARKPAEIRKALKKTGILKLVGEENK